jgi:hypothetical protein
LRLPGSDQSANRPTVICHLCRPNIIDLCPRYSLIEPTYSKRKTPAITCQRTQVYMAEHVGMDRSFISDLENGRKEICIRNLELLATAFGMSVSKLMSRL